jgi:hypothetical protein
MNFTVDDQGVLRSPNLHDGQVLGLHLPERASARVTLADANNQRFLLEMSAVQRLLCNGFAEGNIISELIITTRRAPTLEALRRLVGELHPNVGEPYRTRHENWVSECEAKISNGQLSFVELVPSYGCELLALCESLQLSAIA